MIPEHFLREIWKDHSTFLATPLALTDGSTIQVLNCGLENEHRGGPDFLNARIAIGELAVSGDIELHLTPKHWDLHEHGGDARYSNVILHVVLASDSEDPSAAGPPVPTLVLRDNLLFDRRDMWEALFRKLYDRSPELPCFPHNLLVPMPFKRTVLEKFGEARLDELVDRVLLQDDEVITDSLLLERVYQLTMDALGYAQNRVPFRELSSLVPLERLRFVWATIDNSRIAFEALHFGVAGLIPPPSAEFDLEVNEYILELTSRWNAIQVSLRFPEVLARSDWAFFRIRPANSPYRRLALAALLAEKYFSRIDWNFRHPFFADGPSVSLGDSPFWEERTSFGAKLESPQSLLGDERKSAIWLNVVLPSRLARGRSDRPDPTDRRGERELRNVWGNTRTQASAKYLSTMEQELLESESVSTVRSEQGALLLKRNFCEKSRCSDCPIGHRLMEKGWKPGKV